MGAGGDGNTSGSPKLGWLNDVDGSGGKGGGGGRGETHERLSSFQQLLGMTPVAMATAAVATAAAGASAAGASGRGSFSMGQRGGEDGMNLDKQEWDSFTGGLRHLHGERHGSGRGQGAGVEVRCRSRVVCGT